MYLRQVLISLVCLVLASCATGLSSKLNPVPAGFLYEGSYINIKAPNSDGWYLVKSSPAGMEFGRAGAGSGESFGAQVLMFPLPKTQGEDELVNLVKNAFDADMDLERFTMVSSDFQYSEDRGYPCVIANSVVEDNKAMISSTNHAKLFLESRSLYCRHPVRQDTGFAIIYSFRGNSIYSGLGEEARDYISGVQVPGH